MKTKLFDDDLRLLNELSDKNECEKSLLEKLIKSAAVFKRTKLLRKTVRLNSIVFLWHSLLKKIVKLRIVLPKKADLRSRHISVLSPISLAILGRDEHDTVRVNIGGINKHLKILKVTNKESWQHP